MTNKRLWNGIRSIAQWQANVSQLRSDIIGIPVRVVDQKETTVLGSALFALAGTGLYGSPDEARQAVQYKTEDYVPAGNREKYESLYEEYVKFFESRKKTDTYWTKKHRRSINRCFLSWIDC